MLSVCKVGRGSGREGASVAASLTPPLLLLLLLLLLLAALQTSGDATADTAVLGLNVTIRSLRRLSSFAGQLRLSLQALLLRRPWHPPASLCSRGS